MRGAFESLSLKYRSVLESLRSLTHRPLSTIRVVGGGGLNTLLCQMTADACGCPVVSGPVEASTLGNVMLQAVATGHLSNVRSGRTAIAESVRMYNLFSPSIGSLGGGVRALPCVALPLILRASLAEWPKRMAANRG